MASPPPAKCAKCGHEPSSSSGSSSEDSEDESLASLYIPPELEPEMLLVDVWPQIQSIARVGVGCRMFLTCKVASVRLKTPDALILASNDEKSQHDRTDIETLWLTRFLFRVNRKYEYKFGTKAAHYQVNTNGVCNVKNRHIVVYLTEHTPGCSPARHLQGATQCRISNRLPTVVGVYRICRYSGSISTFHIFREYGEVGNIHEATPEMYVRTRRVVNEAELKALPSWTPEYAAQFNDLSTQAARCDAITQTKKKERTLLAQPTNSRLMQLLAHPCYYDDIPNKYRFVQTHE